MSIMVGLELISSCNLHCKMCNVRSRMSGTKLDRGKVSEIFWDIKRLNDYRHNLLKGIRFDGNTEPLVYKDIKQVLHECNIIYPQRLIRVIQTNGVLMDNDIQYTILSNNITNIIISVTGLTCEIYREFQGANLPYDICEKNFSTVKNNIISLITLKKKMNVKMIVELRYIVTAETADEFIPYVYYWRKQGVNRITFTGYFGKKLTPSYNEVISYKHCSAFEYVMVRASGRVEMFCCETPQYIGNVNEHSFFDIVTSDEVQKYLKAHRELNINEMPLPCRECHRIRVYKNDKYYAGDEGVVI